MSEEGHRREKASVRQNFIFGVLPSGELATPLILEVLGTLQEGVINKHLRAPTSVHVLVKALVDKVLELWGPLLRNPGRLIVHDVEQHAGMVLLDVGRLSFG